VLFGTTILAEYSSCKLRGEDGEMLNRIEIWGIWRPRQQLELFIVFLKSFLNNVFIILLKAGTLSHFHQGTPLPLTVVHGLQKSLGRFHMSN